VALTPELVDRLDIAARREQVSRSLLVREFVAAGLDGLDA
jgi:metal-responsive CopG/Arc/MetJ family transcriptional regulator